MPVAEIITVGTELLLGEIQDTNTRFLARTLRDFGIDIYRTMTVGDNIERVAQAIQEASDRADIIITTGGLGPTVDDPTRDAAAQATNSPLIFHPDLWEQIQARFQQRNRIPTDNNRKQALIPQNATPISNPVGTAPAFIIEYKKSIIICLPGVPQEMEYLVFHAVVPFLKQHFNLTDVIKARILHTIGIGESQLDESIGDLEIISNPTVGLAAHAGKVDIRITAKARSFEEADKIINQMEQVVRQRVGNSIYGCDEQTIENIIIEKISSMNTTLLVLEAGTQEQIKQQMNPLASEKIKFISLPDYLPIDSVKERLCRFQAEYPSTVAMGVSMNAASNQDNLHVLLVKSNGEIFQKTYSLNQNLLPRYQWAANLALNFIRQTL